jgi:transcription initiation factor TFIIIB Brf1 subunit/transcription initiation factor TFIIB
LPLIYYRFALFLRRRMEVFDLIDDLEACFRTLEGDCELDSIEKELAIHYDRCPECGILMSVKTNNQYVCIQCGLLREDVEVTDMSTITSDMNYNTLSNGLRCVGNNAHRYQTILRSQSNYDASPEIHVRNILFAYNHTIGKDGAIPKDVLLNVCEQFKHIRLEGTIYRGTILRAILAAMTYYECLRNKLIFKPSDIYQWFDVDSQTYSKGDKKVREMLDHGFLSEDIREINAESSYLYAYSTKLELCEDHVVFLQRLMELTTEKKLLNPNAKSSTRALCVLHMYLVATEHPIKSDSFKEIFKCNYGTIRTIALDLFHANEVLLPLFDEFKVDHFGLHTYTEKSKKIVRKRRAKNGRIALSD